MGVSMCGVPRDCGCVHVWSGKRLWVCTCVEWQGIVGVYMCGVARDCGCVHVWSGKGIVGVYMCQLSEN